MPVKFTHEATLAFPPHRVPMPFKSKAQRRKFAELLVNGKISPETYEEWNRETGSKKLPERVTRKAPARKRKASSTGRKRSSASRARTTRKAAKKASRKR